MRVCPTLFHSVLPVAVTFSLTNIIPHVHLVLGKTVIGSSGASIPAGVFCFSEPFGVSLSFATLTKPTKVLHNFGAPSHSQGI